MTTFNLLTEGWIGAVRNADSLTVRISLRELLINAHEYRAIRDPLPTVEFGIYRLGIAAYLDAYFLDKGEEPIIVDNAEALMEVGPTDAQRQQLEDYFDGYTDRFDLFSPSRPFLQTAGMGGEEKPLAGLLHPQPSGTNAEFFAHGHEDGFGVCPAAAARLLTTLAPWMTAGGAGLSPSVNGAPPIYALVMGETVWETLWLNLFAGTPSGAKEGGRPAWHGMGDVGGARKTSVTYAEALTWMPRRIRLVPGAGGRCALTGAESPSLVRTMHFGPGDACDFAWRDPNCTYRLSDKGPLVLRLREGRALWRDTGPLALLSGQNNFERPAIVTQAVGPDGPLHGQPLRLAFYGLRTDMKMKVFEWQRETLTLPAGLAEGTAFAADAQTAMEQAEKAAFFLRKAVKMAYPRDGAGNDKALGRLADEAERGFWTMLHPQYDALLARFASLDHADGLGRVPVRTDWAQTVKSTARRMGHDVLDGLDNDGDALRRQTLALRFLDLNLSAVFTPKDVREAQRKARATSQSPQEVLSQ